ncbi:amino acid-binding protein [Arthrobacter sp. KK5.5]|uniref:amino acid-binding protein n=1 Tax=Arthrobacter sp. KK5.5 TaxID=3373084 RepID=UPI003EE64A8C
MLAILPVELIVHAAVIQLELPLLLKVVLLTLAATALAIWVAEPSAARLLRGFLHAPQLRRHRELNEAQALWRLRFSLSDRAGALERVTHELAVVDANILAIHVHPLGDASAAVLDELVVSAPASLGEAQLLGALRTAGARSRAVWPTTPMALADAQTRSLGLAARVAAEPESLAEALSELLGATIHSPAGAVNVSRTGGPGGTRAAPPSDGDGASGTVLRLPTPSGTPLVAHRPGEPFTPAESARAHRLAELAEAVEVDRARRGRPAVLDSPA